MAGLNTHFVIAKKAAYLLEDQGKLILKYSDFFLLGSNSPDLPYPIKDNLWGDRMHYENTGLFVENGINILKEMSGVPKEKCQAWLAGYVSHRVADTVIHPVVNRIVGPYKGNEIQHQLCEKHQDAFVFHDLNLGETINAEYISATISNCANSEGGLDEDVETFWLKTLQQTFPEQETPNISAWFKRYILVTDKLGEEGSWIHVRAAAEIYGTAQLLQINYADINRKDYINDLPSPEGPINFDKVVEKAVNGSVVAINSMFCVLDGKSDEFNLLANWDLDSGKDEADNYIFWQDIEPDIKSDYIHNEATLGLKSRLSTVLGAVLGFCLLLFGSVTNSDSYTTHKSAPLKPLIQKVSETIYSHAELPRKLNNHQTQIIIHKYMPQNEDALKQCNFQREGKYLLYRLPENRFDSFKSDDITTPQLEENAKNLNTKMETK